MLFILVFKDFFKILSFFISVNLNYAFTPLFFLGCVYYGINYIYVSKKNLIILFPMMFFLWVGCYFLVYFIASNAFDYSNAQFSLIIFFNCILPLTLLFAAGSKPALFIFLIKRMALIAGIVTILLSYCILLFILVDKNTVINFFTKLMEAGVIVNPIQTSKASIELRFSSIFNSAYVLALFCNVLLAFTLFYTKRKFYKLILLLLITPILFLTLNRNGMLIALFIISSYYFYTVSYRLFVYWVVTAFTLTFIATLLAPVIIHLLGDLGGLNSSDTALTKLSTLMSRLLAWREFLSITNLQHIILGMGFVQGLANTDFFIDNGFYNLLAQSGIIGLFLFYGFMFYIFNRLLWSFLYFKNDKSAIALLLFCAGFSSMFLNNSFFEIIYLLFYFTFPISILLHNSNIINFECFKMAQSYEN
jgi:hypothetical protein